jgi:hypothetical protein
MMETARQASQAVDGIPAKNILARRSLFVVIIVAAGFSTIGIDWGLPSRSGDQFLLGADYHGIRLEQLTAQVPEVDSSRGADVVGSSGPADQIVPLNDTDAKKAQILCRYRLYSCQPDEMITFRSLSQMKPSRGDFDPRLYQYGGLWIYGVGAIIEAGRLVGLLHITDRAHYIADPQLFGKFYVAARAYSATWGLIGVWAVFELTRRMTGGGRRIPFLSALCFATMPVVVNAAHEAKPHLAGAVLILLAILAADNFVQTGKMRWAWWTGIACGAAMGMVLWAVVSLAVIAAMALQSKSKSACLFRSLLAAFAVYCLTNPYVIFHLLHDPTVLRSNLGNTAAMYGFGRPDRALSNAIWLAMLGSGPLIFPAGMIGCVVLTRWGRGGIGTILAAVSVLAAIQFVATAAGKPGEYGRFALLPNAAIAIACFAMASKLPKYPILIAIELLIPTALWGALYVSGFKSDNAQSARTSRAAIASNLEMELEARTAAYRGTSVRPTLGVFLDPAPYCLPPVDLDGWKIIRLPAGFDAQHGPAVADVIVTPDDSPFYIWWTPLSWAQKNFKIVRRSLADRLAFDHAETRRAP